MLDKKLTAILDELNHHLKTLYKARLVHLILYGSQARGDAEPGSDIDVMVVLKGQVNPGEEIERAGEITAAISLKYNVVISCVFVSVKRFEREKSPLLLNVQQEGLVV